MYYMYIYICVLLEFSLHLNVAKSIYFYFKITKSKIIDLLEINTHVQRMSFNYLLPGNEGDFITTIEAAVEEACQAGEALRAQR